MLKVKHELHFWELSDKCMFWLKSDFWEKLYDLKKNQNLTWKKLGHALGIKPWTLKYYISQLNDFKNAHYIPVQILLKISDFLGLSYIETENFIIKGKYGNNGKPLQISFPINFMTPEWAGLVGAILADGYINKNFGVGFWNTDDEIFNNFLEMASKITPDGFRVNKVLYGCFFPAILGHILIIGLGLKEGDKTKVDIGIPMIYLNSDNEMIVKSLLSWIFTGDGWVTLFKDHLEKTHRTIGIGFGSSKEDKMPQLLINVLCLLKQLEIRHSIPFQRIKEKKDGSRSYSWVAFIKGKNNLINFKKRVGFNSNRKQKILDKAIESYTMPQLRKGESLYLVSNAIQKLNRKGRLVTKHEVRKVTSLKIKRIEVVLKEAKDKNLIEIVGGGIKNPSGGKYPYIYKPTKGCSKFIEKVGWKFV